LWSAERTRTAFLKIVQLPLLRAPDHLAGFFNFGKQFLNASLLVWQHQVGSDIGQGAKDELPQMQPRVRQLQSFGVELFVPAVEQIDINSSRNVLSMIRLSA